VDLRFFIKKPIAEHFSFAIRFIVIDLRLTHPEITGARLDTWKNSKIFPDHWAGRGLTARGPQPAFRKTPL
jgi:hypothetical protein